MKRKILSILLALCMLTAFVPCVVSAASGECGKDGDNLTWTLNNAGTLTISGEGEMMDYSTFHPPWYGNRSSITKIVIEQGVTDIGDEAFGFCSSLTSITTPDSLTSIGELAFSDCISLTNVTISDSVTNIGFEAFSACGSLNISVDQNNTSYCDIDGVLFNKNKSEILAYSKDKIQPNYTIPGSVTSIGKGAFYFCDGLTSVTIPDSVISINENAFFSCSALASVTIPNSVTSIGYYAFEGCENLTSVTIGSNVTSIGELAFYSCSGLTSITIPDSVTSIDNGAFWDCSSLTSITIGNGVTSIGDYAFDGCDSLTDVYYGGSNADWGNIEIGEDNDCLLNATIHYNGISGGGAEIVDSGKCGKDGGNLTWTLNNTGTLTISGKGEMEDYDFSYTPWYESDSNIKKVVIDQGVTSIGNEAFSECTGLTNVTIPDSVTNIGLEAFSACGSLNISVDQNNTSFCDIDGVLFNKNKSKIIAYSKDKIQPNYTIPGSVTSIGESAFKFCTSLTSITIGNGVTSISCC